jgi:hypothetical protein
VVAQTANGMWPIADIITLRKSDCTTVGNLLPLSLDSRIGILRRRRRVDVLRQLVAVIGPLMIGGSILLLVAASGVVASAR